MSRRTLISFVTSFYLISIRFIYLFLKIVEWKILVENIKLQSLLNSRESCYSLFIVIIAVKYKFNSFA